jgi:ParB family chromosome partitioning protein
VPITSIAPNPYQPRKHIDPEILQELADSIKVHGLIQPPVVSYNPNFEESALSETFDETDESAKLRRARYLLIAGERRWQASKLSGLTQIPVVIKETTPIQMLELALVENIQRADLNPLEEANAYRQLVSEFRLTQEEVAHKVGKSRSAVTNALRLLDLPEEILESINEGSITEGHARAILQVKDKAAQLRLLSEIILKGMSVRQTEETARRVNINLSTREALKEAEEAAKAEKQLRLAQMENREIEVQLQSALGFKVDLTRSKKGGKITIPFADDQELDSILRKITDNYEI